jgi:Arc/MetJ family transcription regulator
MKVTITIADDLINKTMEYTGCSSITETANIVFKDWLAFYRIREKTRKIPGTSMYLGNRHIPYQPKVKIYNMS